MARVWSRNRGSGPQLLASCLSALGSCHFICSCSVWHQLHWMRCASCALIFLLPQFFSALLLSTKFFKVNDNILFLVPSSLSLELFSSRGVRICTRLARWYGLRCVMASLSIACDPGATILDNVLCITFLDNAFAIPGRVSEFQI